MIGIYGILNIPVGTPGTRFILSGKAGKGKGKEKRRISRTYIIYFLFLLR